MTCTLPQDQLARVTPDLLRAYLEARGWLCVVPELPVEGWNVIGGGRFGSLTFAPDSFEPYGCIINVAYYEDRCPRAVLSDVLGKGEANLGRVNHRAHFNALRPSFSREKADADWEKLTDAGRACWRIAASVVLRAAGFQRLEAENTRLRAALEEIAQRRDGGGWLAREALGQEATP